MNIYYRISAEGYAMYLFRVTARTQTAACMKLSVLLGIAAENCRVMETLPSHAANIRVKHNVRTIAKILSLFIKISS